MFRTTIFSTALLAAAITAGAARAADAPASFVVVHGIPGRDVGSTLDPLLPVDVLVAGKYCLLQGFTFGSIAGPYDIPAGTYTVAISLANPLAPCSNSAVISGSVTLSSGEFGAIVAALSTKGAPTAEVYPIDVSAVGAGKQRFVAAHAADAPAVKVTIVSTGKTPEKEKFTLDPGAEKSATVASAPGFTVTAKAGSAVIGPLNVAFGDQGVDLIVAVGSATTGSATLLSKIIPDVF
jgi:hypothetical protein